MLQKSPQAAQLPCYQLPSANSQVVTRKITHHRGQIISLEPPGISGVFDGLCCEQTPSMIMQAREGGVPGKSHESLVSRADPS
jgi:hypothetical protein